MQWIFIGGVERSGTTLLASLLGAGQKYTATPESQFKRAMLLHWNRCRARDRYPNTGAWGREVAAHRRFRHWGVAMRRWYQLPPETPLAERLASLVADYAEQRQALNGPEAWIDHSPENIRYAAALGAAFPEVRFVHLVRDGRAVAASQMPLPWGPNHILDAAAGWVKTVALGLAAEQAMPERVLRLHYETLVRQPESTLRWLCARLGLTYDPRMPLGGGFLIPGYTEPQHRRVAGPPDPERLDAWRKRLSAREMELFEAQTADLLALLGYPMDYGLAARGPTKAEKLRLGAFKWARKRLVHPWAKLRRKLR
jgi:hypothetical protein